MDFMQRGSHQAPAGNGSVVSPTENSNGGHKGKMPHGLSWMKATSLVLLFSMLILAVAVIISLVVSGNVKTESKYVNNKELQAVFLNGGQVYFGNITNLNSKYLKLNNIYYLRVNQTVQPNQTSSSSSSSSNQSNDISLVKLGGELHCPEDQMIINQDQVMFWENLKSDGQVAKAVADYVKTNPTTTPSCTTTTSSNSSSTNSPSSSNSSSTSNSSSSSSTTKKQ